MENPRCFISYCWTDGSHQDWVLNLANQLVKSGVDVLLDKWDLKTGHDAVAFMEKMATDPSIGKVVIVSNKLYAEKADGREGGVGTETQIITPELYGTAEQDKFALVVAEKDPNGKPYLPTYYKSRIYIDLCTAAAYSENFDQLLRWLYDEPVHVRPQIGSPPVFLRGDSSAAGTLLSQEEALSALKTGNNNAVGLVAEFFAQFSESIEGFRISEHANGSGEFDDLLVANITDFLPYRKQIVQVVFAIARFGRRVEFCEVTHRFLESLLPYIERPKHITRYHTWGWENFKFLVHELFLTVLAIAMKCERFDMASAILQEKYYHPEGNRSSHDPRVEFSEFRSYLQSLEHRNKRLELRRLSMTSDFLVERITGTGLNTSDLMVCVPRSGVTDFLRI